MLYDILSKLINNKSVGMCSTTPLVYHVDGITPNLPIARKLISYKTLRWLPVTFSIFDEVKADENLFDVKLDNISSMSDS